MRNGFIDFFWVEVIFFFMWLFKNLSVVDISILGYVWIEISLGVFVSKFFVIYIYF